MIDGNPNDLYYFALVVKYQSFTNAAVVAGVEKSTLSRRVKQLETDLGVELLKRHPRGILLTEAGETLYVHCQQAITHLDAGIKQLHSMRSEAVGTVRIACPVQIAQTYMPEVTARFLMSHPNVNVSLDATDRAVDLDYEPYDLAIRVRDSIMESEDYVVKEIANLTLELVASPPLAARYGLQQLMQGMRAPSIVPEVNHEAISSWSLFYHDEPVSILHCPRLVSSSVDVRLQSALSGVGLALLPNLLTANYVRSGLLLPISPEIRGSKMVMHLIYHRPWQMMPAVKAFRDFISEHLPKTIQTRFNQVVSPK